MHTSDRVRKQYDLSKCTDTISELAALLLAKIVKYTKKLQFNVLKRAFKMIRSSNTTPRYFTESTNCKHLLPSINGLHTELKRGPILRATDW